MVRQEQLLLPLKGKSVPHLLDGKSGAAPATVCDEPSPTMPLEILFKGDREGGQGADPQARRPAIDSSPVPAARGVLGAVFRKGDIAVPEFCFGAISLFHSLSIGRADL